MTRKTNPDALRIGARFELDAFDRQIEAALEHCTDPAWLSARSPLAAPYFLGEALAALPARPATERMRGELFARLLRDCAATLDDELQALLQITYFARNPAHDNVALALAMNISDRTFYRTRILAIKALARALHTAVVSSVRMERPVAGLTVGRDALLTRAQLLLEAGRSLYLIGSNGIGKSTFAAALAEEWQADGAGYTFWYTLRDRANDHAASLHFALAWFLQTVGAGNTWRQLVADRTVGDFERTLSLLRFDLEALSGRRLLFCIDDADTLQDERAEHVQIAHTLEMLRSHASLLLVGQRQVLGTDEVLLLQGLDDAAVGALFAAAGAPPLSAAAVTLLREGAHGNPALLRLIALSAQQGDDPLGALADLGRAPTIEALLHRIWRRMDEGERNLALQLALFRTPSPADAWRNEAASLRRLGARGLLVNDAQGGVLLQPHLRALIEERIPAEMRPRLHARAANVCAARAEYTRAVEHAIAARQPAQAVWFWFSNRRIEIDRGLGSLALQLLRTISLDDLPDARDRTALHLARGELYQLAGCADEALDDLRRAGVAATSADVPADVMAYVQLEAARAEEMANQVEQALESYRSAISLYVGLPAQHEVRAHLRLSFLHMYRRHEADAARREAILARAKANAFLGDLEAMAGRYEDALASLHAAEAALDQQEDPATRADVCTYLSTVYGQLGEYERALAYLDRAIECDQRRGDEVGILYVRLNRAWALKELGRFDASEQEARKALLFAEQLHNSYLVAGLAAGVAEACWAQGKWEEAEHYSLHSLEQEEIFFRAAACVTLAGVRAQQARHTEAAELFAAAIEQAQQIYDRATEAYAWREWGRAALYAGNTQKADDALARATEIYSDLHLEHGLQSIALLRAQESAPPCT